MKFSTELAKCCCQLKLRTSLINSSIIHWSKKCDIGTKQPVATFQLPNWIMCKAAILNWQPVWEKDICSDSNWIAQQLQMAEPKSLETMSGFWHDSEPIATNVYNQIIGPNWLLINLAHWPFCAALSQSVHCLGFCQWLPRNVTVLTLPSTWSPAQGQDLAACEWA